jgi:hypothetical protein
LTNRDKKDNLDITGSLKIFYKNVKNKTKKEKGQMKTKLISTFAVLVLTLGLFLGFKISDNIFGSKNADTYDVRNYQPQQTVVTDNAPIYTDNFDGDNTVTGLQARGYKAFNNSVPVGTTVWFQGNPTVFPAFNGPSSGYVGANFNATTGANKIDVWMISPKMSLLSGDSLVFYCRSTDIAATNYPDSVKVYFAPTGDSTAAGTYTEIGKFKAVNPAVGSGAAGYQRKAFRMGADAPNGRFVIRYNVVNGGPSGANSDYIGIDALSVERAAAPPPPAPTTWYEQTATGVTGQLYGISAPDINNVWACGAAGKVIRTTNGGTWAAASGNLATSDLYAIWAFDANTALVTNSPSATNVFRTTNGGTNWTQVFTQAGGFINAFYFKDANNGIMQGDAVGGRFSLWKTTNGGVNWDSTGMNIPSTEAGWTGSLHGIGDVVWFGTNSTKVYKSTNFGTTWTSSPTTGEANGYSIWFNDVNNGFVGGTTMQKTTNGGTNWAAHTVPGTGTIQALTGWKTTNTYFMGRANIVYSTTNNGTNWNTVFTAAGTSQIWNFTVSRTGSPYVYGCRANGTIVKYGGSATGISPVTTIADSYSLSQNYPNPFNPTTNIKFAIPQSGLVTLKIYNMLGKEVSTLVSSNLSAGTYSYDFNASNLASGVYFYKLETANFSEVKKMSLIK